MRMQDSKAQEDALIKQIEKKNKSLRYGLQYIQSYKRTPKEGTIFAYQMGEDGLWRFGRYMTRRVYQGFDLVYFYKATSKSKDDIPKLSRDDLLFYPVLTCILGMVKTGYFVNVEHREIKKEDLLEKHIYYSFADGWVDEDGNPIEGQKPKDWHHYELTTPGDLCSLLGNNYGLYSMSEKEVIKKCGLVSFEKYKERPPEGTIFACRNVQPTKWYGDKSHLWHFGRYMQHDCVKKKYSLIYLYKGVSESKDDIPKLDKNNLITYPYIVDANEIAKTGYFVNVAQKKVKQSDLLEQHYFWWGRKKQWVDQFGKIIEDPSLPQEWVYQSFSFSPIFDIYRFVGLKKALEEDKQLSKLRDKLRVLARFSYSNFESGTVADYNATFVKKKNWQQDIEKTLNRIFEGDVDISEELEALYALEVLMAVRGYPSEDVGKFRSFKNWTKKHQGEEVPKDLMKLGDKVMKYFTKEPVMLNLGNIKEPYRQFWIDEIFKDMKKRWKLAKKK